MQTLSFIALLGCMLLALRFWFVNRRLLESEQRYGVIFEGTNEVMLVLDSETGAILEANAAALRFYGYERARMLRMNIAEINTLAPEEIRAEMRRAKTQERDCFFFPHRLAGGEVREVEVHSAPIRHGSKTVLCSFVHDITERRKYEQSLLSARESADAASRAKTEFLANMSHELRTPLNGVIGNAQLLQLLEPSGEQAECLAAILRSGNRLTSLIDDILDLSRLESERVLIEPAEFSLRKCLSDAVATQRFDIAQKGLSFRLELREELPDALMGDRVRLSQIVGNLLDNAVKFTAEGGIVLSAALLEREDGGELLELAVSDTGIGIPQAMAQDIFKPFVQVDGSSTRRYGGCGLGLAISQRLDWLMGGGISAESAEGAGSTFRVLLPLRPAGESVAQAGGRPVMLARTKNEPEAGAGFDDLRRRA